MIYAGCSGYSFKEWVGSFYPPKTKAADYLAHYASELNSVEINHTFRRFPRLELIERWAQATPESFRFSFKMHQSVTHRYRLKNVEQSVSDFLEQLVPLGPRLGVVLFQLPPFFKKDLERLHTFVGALPDGFRFALEFRHDSWDDDDVRECLSDRGVALCAADLEIEDTDIVHTAPFAYLRLRKEPPYTDSEIETARSLIRKAQEQVGDVYLYAKHDDEGAAPAHVQRISAKVVL